MIDYIHFFFVRERLEIDNKFKYKSIIFWEKVFPTK